MPHENPLEERWTDVDMKQLRLEHPSGWLNLTQKPGRQLIIDALIDGADREFNKSELALFAGVSRPTIDEHLNLLLQLDVVEAIENTSPQRYTFDPDSPVSKGILEVNGAVLANEASQTRR